MKPSRPVDAVLVVGLALSAGALAFAAPVAAGLGAAAVLVALARAGSRFVALLGAAAFLVGALRAEHAVVRFEERRAPLVRDGAWPSRCVLSGVVVRSPARAGDALRVDVDVGAAACDAGSFAGQATLHVPVDVAPVLARGDRVEGTAQLAPAYRFWNDGTGDPRPAQARRGTLLSGGALDVRVVVPGRGVLAAIDRARDRIRRRILATYPGESAAMARALVLGEDDLAGDDQRAFRRSGLAHLLAVSGMHLVLVVAGLVAALRAILVRIPSVAARFDAARVAAVVGIPIAWIYEDLAGASGSAVRAAWMTSAALLAQALARRSRTSRALGLSILAMALVDPLVAFDLSFALSAAATGGLLVLASRLERLAADRLPLRLGLFAKPMATTAAATIACAPIIACMSGELPIGGLVANLVAVPLGEAAALPLCLVHALLEPLPLAERGCALAAAGALDLVRVVARGFAAVPWGALPVPTPTPGQLAALAVGAFGVSGIATRRPGRWALGALVVIVLLEKDARARAAPKGVLRVTFLDVGQGDAALVDLPDGSAMLVDGGGLVGSPLDTGERVIAPVLRARRRRTVDVVMLSHPHPDHFSGLRVGLDAARVGAFWDTGQGEAESVGGGYAETLAKLRARGVPVLHPADLCGIHTIGGAIVEVLAPCPSVMPDRGPNDNSFVVRIRHGDRAVLLAGDAEHEEEADLLAARPDSIRADVLKVGHHGSRTSSTRGFLAAVSPSVAVISCGIRNRFGHPHRSTLTSLGASGARVYRTDRDGAVTITTDGKSLDVHTATE